MSSKWPTLGSDCQEHVLHKVFAFLSAEDTKLCRLVCRQWREASRTGVTSLRPKSLSRRQLWKLFPRLSKLDLTRVGDLTDTVLDELCRLKKLTAVRLCLVTDTWLHRIRKLTQLQTLNLASATCLTDNGLIDICQVLMELRYLNLKRCCCLTDTAFREIPRLVKLGYLNISALPELTSAGLEKLNQLHNLNVLKIKDCPEINDEGVEFLLKLPQLTTLYLRNRFVQRGQLTDLSLAGMAWSLTELRKLVITCSQGYSLSGFDEFIHFRKLRELHLSSVIHFDSVSICAVLGRMTGLEKLLLEGCGSITSEEFRYLTQLQQMQTLSLSSARVDFMPQLTDSAVTALSVLPQLRSLFIRGFALLTGRTIHELTNLTSLTLVGCPDITNQHFTGLAHLRRLKSLEHRYCDGLTDTAFQSIAALKKLESLTITCNSSIQGVDISVLSSLGNLSRISISQCASLTDAGFVHLTSLKSLKSIDCSGCRRVTDIGMQHLALGQLPYLEYIRVADCDVRSANVNDFTQFSPRLRKIDRRRSNPTIPDLFRS